MSQNIPKEPTEKEALDKSKVHYQNDCFNLSKLVFECRNSQKLVILVVCIALFFDSMLMTIVGKINSHSVTN